MLHHLTTAEALAIAEDAARVSRDEKAMIEYLGIGRGRRGAPPDPAQRLVVISDLSAFESVERASLKARLGGLSPAARLELVALLWLGRSIRLDYDAALRRARRVPAEYQVATLMGARLERHIPAALAKLGLKI